MGMDRETGRELTGVDHVRQSIVDILTTPIGSRTERRDYGSKLFSMIDSPTNREGLVDIYAATAEAIAKWENRYQLEQVDIVSSKVGQLILDLTGKYVLDGKVVKLSGIVIE